MKKGSRCIARRWSWIRNCRKLARRWALNLMRLGREDEARAQLEQSWNAGYQSYGDEKYADAAGHV